MFETRRRSWAKARLRDGNGAIDAKEGLGAIVPLLASRAALQQALPSLSRLMRMLPCGPIRGRLGPTVRPVGRPPRTAGGRDKARRACAGPPASKTGALLASNASPRPSCRYPPSALPRPSALKSGRRAALRRWRLRHHIQPEPARFLLEVCNPLRHVFRRDRRVPNGMTDTAVVVDDIIHFLIGSEMGSPPLHALVSCQVVAVDRLSPRQQQFDTEVNILGWVPCQKAVNYCSIASQMPLRLYVNNPQK